VAVASRLIRSDGCVFINRTGAYRYETYEFRNQSRDLLDLFSQTCDRVGVDHRRTRERIRINRRDAVAAMLAHVGPEGLMAGAIFDAPAAVAELADAPSSGGGGQTPVEVRVLSAALSRCARPARA
jgi:hypothetical protein